MSVTLDDDEAIQGLRPDGRPDPEYARSLGLIPARAGRRSAAFAIDTAIVLVLTLPLTLGALPRWLPLLSGIEADPAQIATDSDFLAGLLFFLIGQGMLTVFVLTQIILHGVRGITVGKAVVGIRSVNAATFRKPGFWRILLRAIVFWSALSVIPLIGAVPFLLSPLWDGQKRGRGWLDFIGGNWMIDVRRGLDPFDPKALRNARRRVERPDRGSRREMPSLATGATGAVPSFVPGDRSSSAVIMAAPVHEEGGPWQPPVIVERDPAPGVVSPVVAPSAAASPHPPVGSSTAAMATMSFDDGLLVPISGSGLIGRNPEPRDGERMGHLVSIADESRQLSKTHAAFEVDSDGVWIVDRGSVNGTTVAVPGSVPHRLVPWEREKVAWNAIVEIGGRTFTPSPAPHTDGDA